MPLIDVPIPEKTMEDYANIVREELGVVVRLAEAKLHLVRNLVRHHGRAAIAAELGDDAAVLLTVYTKLKEAIEVAKEIVVEELP